MSSDITYIGKIDKPEKQSKEEALKEPQFKEQSKNKKVEKFIASTKSKLLNKKFITILLIILLIWYFKPITFLRNKLDEKKSYYDMLNSTDPFHDLDFIGFITYTFGTDYYKNLRNTLVMPADGLVTYQYDYNHPGIDIACDNYQDNIYAAANGYVCYIGNSEKYGNELMIEHEINGQKFYTFYGNLSSINVSLNEYVVQNQPIALEGGNPNKKASVMEHDGHHIHFEVRKTKENSSHLDPNILIK